MAKTVSTFTIHHDRCDPSKWTATEWMLLINYVKTGSLVFASGLSRIGMQLNVDSRHESEGGTLEHIGWLSGRNGEVEHDDIAETIEDLDPDCGEVIEVVPIYRGQTKHAVLYAIGDGEGGIDGYEVETCETLEEARQFAASLEEATHGG